MKPKSRDLYQSIIQSYPIIESLARRIFPRIPLKRIIGQDNIIQYGDSTLSSVFFDIKGNGNKIIIEDSCYLNDFYFRIYGDNHTVHIGEKCRFSRGGSIWLSDSDNSLEIGDRSTFVNVHLSVSEPSSKLEIGHDCMFANDIDVRTGDSHSIIDLENNERFNHAESTFIGNRVWVASHCIILKGVHIADESVVAAGSVVTKKFPQGNVIIAGNPAKVVKTGITWSRKKIFGKVISPNEKEKSST